MFTAIYVHEETDFEFTSRESVDIDRYGKGQAVDEADPYGRSRPERKGYAHLEPGATRATLEPGIYRIISAEAVVVAQGASARGDFTLSTVTQVTSKDDWPDPPRKITAGSLDEIKAVRTFVVGRSLA